MPSFPGYVILTLNVSAGEELFVPGPIAHVTERTFYPALIDYIKECGGSGVTELFFDSEPDSVFKLLNRDWLLSVKISERITTLKSGFIQYQRHKDERRLTHGSGAIYDQWAEGARLVDFEVDTRGKNER